MAELTLVASKIVEETGGAHVRGPTAGIMKVAGALGSCMVRVSTSLQREPRELGSGSMVRE
jgi:hypothetical protein